MANIHPTACVDSAAELADDVKVGPYAVIYAGAKIGAGCEIGPHAVIHGWTRLGERVKVHAHAVLGDDPQDLHFDTAQESYVIVGNDTVLREGVTLHRATVEGAATTVGKNCLFMAYAHAAHDAKVGDNAILANNVMMAGHSEIEPYAVVGGGVGLHQSNRIGEGAMIGGVSRVSNDAPPFCMVSGESKLYGLNLIGMKRRGFSRETIREIKLLYHALYDESCNLKKKATELLETVESDEARRFLTFFTNSKRGVFATPERK